MSRESTKVVVHAEKVVIYQPDRLLKIEQVQQLIGLGRRRIFDLVKEGKFPRPREIGSLAV